MIELLQRVFIGVAEPAQVGGTPSGGFWMPNPASTVADEVDWAYYALVAISTVSGLLVFGAMTYFVIRYRAKSRSANERVGKVSEHNTALEITWSVIPLVILIAVFVWGFKGYVTLRTPPKDTLDIQVTAQKWSWNFTYPSGLTDSTLHVPAETPVRIVISSADVLHSLYIPAFRVKMDAVPGRYTDLWFEANRTGEFQIFCAEYCGTSHSDMLSKVVVHPRAEYDRWMDDQIRKLEGASPAELGARLYEKQGCAACHSVDGSTKIGPTLKGLWGRQEALVGGASVEVDENYIKESLFEPQAKIVQGFSPSMPTYKGKLSDREVTGIIEYIKTLK